MIYGFNLQDDNDSIRSQVTDRHRNNMDIIQNRIRCLESKIADMRRELAEQEH